MDFDARVASALERHRLAVGCGHAAVRSGRMTTLARRLLPALMPRKHA
jgi:hypothetical protein